MQVRPNSVTVTEGRISRTFEVDSPHSQGREYEGNTQDTTSSKVRPYESRSPICIRNFLVALMETQLVDPRLSCSLSPAWVTVRDGVF